MRLWITKYVLENGIVQMNGFKKEDVDNPDGGSIKIIKNGNINYFDHNQWWRTKEEAIKYANAEKVARLKKIKDDISYLNFQIRQLDIEQKKLNELNFNIIN